MKKMIKKYRGSALLILLFAFSLHINAVFEGRNEKLQDYTGVRNNVEIESYNADQKASWSIDEIKDKMNDEKNATTGDGVTPIGDSPWLILALGLGYGLYILVGKNRERLVE